jgi:hypothetical protein
MRTVDDQRSQDMAENSRARARSLELIIRGAAAEERMLGRRLESVAEAQRRTRADIASELRREHFGHMPEWGQADGSSDR